MLYWPLQLKPEKRKRKIAKAPEYFLYQDLPAVLYKKDYLIFSPYARAVARVPFREINNPKIKKELEKSGFFRHESYKERIILVTLILTTDCNFRCKYCYLKAGENPEYMDPELARDIVKRFLKQKPQRISMHFFGGEPTLNMSAIDKVVDMIKNAGIDYRLHITTNGAISVRNLDYLIRNKFSFTVSMDSIPHINNKERVFFNGNATSQVVERTIKKLAKTKAKVSIRATVTKSNSRYLPKAIDYWSDLGIRYVHFELMNPVGRGKKLPGINTDEYIRNVKKALDVAEKNSLFIINSAYMNLLTPSDYFCMSCKGERWIFLPDGTISLCYEAEKDVLLHKNFIIGRFDKEKQDFIINTNRLKNMQKINIDFFEKCRDCFAKYICAGGCLKRNLEATGSFFRANHIDCKIKKELVRDAIIRIYRASKNNKMSCVFGTNIFENF